MNEHRDHELFQQYPLSGEAQVSTGTVPTPYHIYDGQGTFIGGFADLTKITKLLQDEQLYPIRTTSGQAVMGIWVVDFTDASLGAHNELQFSILVSPTQTTPIEDHPLTLLKALFMNPDAHMLCYGLWNNTETVVAYNRELLGLPAQLNKGKIEDKNGTVSFQFADENGEDLFTGKVKKATKANPKVGWSLFRLLGLRQTMNALSQPYLGAKVINPISERLPYNGSAQSFLAADAPIVQFFDPTTDSISFGPAFENRFAFQPQFVEHFEPFRFVYLHPETL